jgi:flagellar biosynthesis protein FlhB
MPEQHGDKTQEATPHRRQQAREEGQVAKSQDLGSAILLILGLLCLMMLGEGLANFLGEYARHQLGDSPWLSADAAFAVSQWNQVLAALARFVLPIFGLLFIGAILVNVLQIGFLFLPANAAPDIARLDPLRGLGRIFSMSNVVRLVFSIFKLGIIATVAFLSIYQQRHAILDMTSLEAPQIAIFLLQLLFGTAMKIAIALLILAIFDYGFQRWKYEQDIKMTPQEVREEMRNLEGDPQIIARRRVVQRQLVSARLASAVPKADVVITNPTELAVAIQYEPETMAAPIVVAKGAGMVAERIRRLALEHNIPIVEKKPLAQALFKEVEINHPIPPERYTAVAEVLAYVYQLQGKTIPMSQGI